MASLNDLDKKLTQVGESATKRTQDALGPVATPNKIAEKRRQLEECYAALGKAVTDNSNGTLPRNFQARQASSAAQAGNASQTPPAYANPYAMPQQSGYYPHLTEEQLPAKFKPLGAWAYLGWNIIFVIPVVGIIMLLIKAFGNTENVNLQNYARFICYMYILGILIGIIVGATGCLAAFAFI